MINCIAGVSCLCNCQCGSSTSMGCLLLLHDFCLFLLPRNQSKNVVVVVCSLRYHIKNAHHCPSCNRMAASCSCPCNAMIFLLVVAWRDLASLVAINLCCHRFLRYDVPKYARCCYPHDQQCLLLSSFDWMHEIFACCILASGDGWITVVAPRQYDCFPQHQKILCCCIFAMIDMLLHAVASSPFLIWRKKYVHRRHFLQYDV